MTVAKNRSLAIVAGGMLLTVAGLMMGKANEPVFGLSGDFLAGFLLGVGLAAMIAGAAMLLLRKD